MDYIETHLFNNLKNFKKMKKPNTTTVEPLKTRYSDEEQEEFRTIILQKLEKARSDYEITSGLLKNPNAGSDTNHDNHETLEMGSRTTSQETNQRLAERSLKFIRGLENALIRIDNRTYGICRLTGKLIRKERLKSVPHATTEVAAKNAETNRTVKHPASSFLRKS